MGCVSSTLLNQDNEFTPMGRSSAGFSHHIVSLTSTTYGLLTLDPPTPPPPPPTTTTPPTPTPPRRHTLGSLFPSPLSEPRALKSDVINSWELMAGLDSNTNTPLSESFRFSSLPIDSSFRFLDSLPNKENSSPNVKSFSNGVHKVDIFSPNIQSFPDGVHKAEIFQPSGVHKVDIFTNGVHQEEGFKANIQSFSDGVHKNEIFKANNHSFTDGIHENELFNANFESFRDGVYRAEILKGTRLCDLKLDGFEKLCPPNGEDKIVIYTTTLRGVRKTFKDCNAVRSTIEGLGVLYSERDVSMDKGFRDELKELMKGKDGTELIPPRVFFKGRYIGGAEEVMRIVEEGNLGEFLRDLPKVKLGSVCEGCGGVRFLPCFTCNGSCKVLMVVKEDMEQKGGRNVMVRCTECNENGLVLCPICC